jgi:selT/selW/selH-like putative selenoprotein
VGYFQEVKQQLEYRYKDVQVIPEQYPLKNPRKLIYNLMIALEMIIIIMIALSDFIKPKIEQYVIPDLINLFNENKLAKIAMVFLMGQYIGQIISNAGAFEVFCDDKLIWSTIEHNGIKPNLSTIIRLVKQLE